MLGGSMFLSPSPFPWGSRARTISGFRKSLSPLWLCMFEGETPPKDIEAVNEKIWLQFSKEAIISCQGALWNCFTWAMWNCFMWAPCWFTRQLWNKRSFNTTLLRALIQNRGCFTRTGRTTQRYLISCWAMGVAETYPFMNRYAIFYPGKHPKPSWQG